MLTDWFARKNVDDTIICITVPYQVCSITVEFVHLQSGSLFYQRAKHTGGQYNSPQCYFRPTVFEFLSHMVNFSAFCIRP